MDRIIVSNLKVTDINYRKNRELNLKEQLSKLEQNLTCRLGKRGFRKSRRLSCSYRLGSGRNKNGLFSLRLEFEARILPLTRMSSQEIKESIEGEIINHKLLPFIWTRVSNITALNNKYPPYDLGFNHLDIDLDTGSKFYNYFTSLGRDKYEE